MNRKYVISSDIGTSGCKTLIVDDNRDVVASETIEYPLYTPRPGWTEQDPSDWWEATAGSIRNVINKSGVNPKQIACVGLSGQMHGMVALDKNFNVLRRAILWNDQRTEKQCSEITSAAGGEASLLKYTNNKMLPGYTGGKILWLRENEPLLYEKLRLFVNPKDYLRYKLTSEIATEVSDASGTGLFDVKNRRWSDELIGILKLPKEIFPRCYESTEITGRLTKKAAEETGLSEGTPVVGGGGDAVIQTTGMGLIKEGVLGLTIGTAGIAAMGLGSFKTNIGGKMQVFCNNAPNVWHVMGVSLAAGGSYQWYKNHFCEGEAYRAQQSNRNIYDILDEDAGGSTPGANGLVFLPYLNGERCPYTDVTARGVFFGLSLLHQKRDMTRAILEGVQFSLRQMSGMIQNLDAGIQVREIIVSGGGSRSALWRQIQADVFQCPVKTLKGSAEGGAYGAALIAGVGCGLWKNVDEAVSNLCVESETLPNQGLRKCYQELYDVYQSLYPALSASYKMLYKVISK